MDRDKKARKTIRSAFSKIYNLLVNDLKADNPDKTEIQANLLLLEQKTNDLRRINEIIFQHLLDKNAADGEMDQESEIVDEYQRKYNKIHIDASSILDLDNHIKKIEDDALSSVSTTATVHKRKFKLPDIELKKYGGDIKEWIHFWGQFRKIDEDLDLADEDKFQYLIQATIEGSRAREFVNSFPPSADNYSKVINGLKNRFGQEDMLIEVYVRELLTLVLKKVLSKDNQNLYTLYDKLESHLRALESLGVTSDKYAAMLYPLVESCLPEELLRTWQRMSAIQKQNIIITDAGSNEISTVDKRLKKLMNFICSEVQNEERIKLANNGFNLTSDSRPKKKGLQTFKENDIPSAASLVSVTNEKVSKFNNCIFCDKKHNSVDCFKAKKMTLDEKKKVIEDKKCCFYCLKNNHFARKCRTFIKCTICDGRHIVLMCPNLNNCRENCNSKNSRPESEHTDTIVANSIINPEVFLQTLVVKLKNNNKTMLIRAMIDTGSQKSYILEDTVNQMNLQYIGKVKLSHALFGGVKTAQQVHKKYKVVISSRNNDYTCNIEALSQSVIINEVSHIHNGIWMQEIKKLGIQLTDTGEIQGPIQLLIGADVAGQLFMGNREQLNCGLVALRTKLGWTVMGKVSQEVEEKCHTSTSICMFVKIAKIQDLWELDTLGIRDPVEVKMKREKELQVQSQFLESVRINNHGRYEVVLPWISDKPELPTNYEIAKRRLISLTNKLKSEGNLENYEQVFQSWCKEGIIEEIKYSEGGHYLPHRHVLKENSTTKIRPVFDASSKTKNYLSLNECLEVGPNLIELIPSLLMRFRLKKIGVISDIKRAFLQVSVVENDRNYLRFLWWNDDGEIKIYRHNRVVFGVASSPFLLGGVINYHFNRTLKEIEEKNCKEEISEETVKRLMKSFYVDNCVTSVSNQNELNQFIKEAKTVMSRACFDLRCWEYTSDSSSDEINQTALVLGLKWNKNTDTLEINLNSLKSLSNQIVTKRLILSITHKLFDPIGFICPIIIFPKLLLQQTWQTGIGWDTEVNEDTKVKFLKWYEELDKLSRIKIPRWVIGETNEDDISVHTFCDASQTAYAAAVFVRVKTEDKVNVQLIQAKARVSPLKKMTIPRLELMAATIGARLSVEIMTNLDWSGKIPITYWTDSTTVLTWLKRDEKLEVFVRNRIQEIRQLTNIENWRHIPGDKNPADLPSRGCSIRQFLELKWWEGPTWMKSVPEEWPQSQYNHQEELLFKSHQSTMLTICKSNPEWYYEYFSDYQKIVRLIAWIVRFLNYCRITNGTRIKGNLTNEEILRAEKQIFQLIQQDIYGEENIKNLSTLNVFRDQDNIIRVKTQITLREDTEDFRYPIVLPDQHAVVKLLIMDRHRRLSHAGTQILLNSLREEFWITRGRRAVRSVIKGCLQCKRYAVKNVETLSCPLPINRVREARVFEVIGVDLAGPLHLKDGKKAWICLFTCAVYRAVHIELVTSLSTIAFVQALRRFIARRGRPKTIYSDNGTNFVGTENLFSAIDWENIEECATIQRIEWRFNPPTAAWWGGWWERLIKIIKDLLKRVLGKACLNYEEMLTLLNECEAVVNSRPLTYMMDGDPSTAPLTPNMFLQEINCVGVPDIDQADKNSLNKRVTYINKLRTQLRQRFRNEYLGCLKQRSNRKTENTKISVGDLVLIGSDNKKRLDWPIAKVIELKPGQDGVCRLVKLKTANGEMLRPVQRLYPLEISSEHPANINTSSKSKVLLDKKDSEIQISKSGRKIIKPRKYQD